jgi:hypothetical protein
MTNLGHNDQVLLDQILDIERTGRGEGTSVSDFFEQYVAAQLLKDYDISDDELEYGLVGGPNDGGIDAIYTLANGEMVQEDFEPGALKKNVEIDVLIIQAKVSNGFEQTPIDKLIAVTGHLFSLAHNIDEYEEVYNEGLRTSIQNFRVLYTAVAGRFPTLRFTYCYATRGDSSTVHPNVKRKGDDLNKLVKRLFPHAEVKCIFLGATNLLALARRQPSISHELKFLESLTGRDGYIALVRLQDFATFLRSDSGQLRKNIFEANVRDYQGSNTVNEEMQQTLTSQGPEDFWWLNNGVTIVSSRAVQGGKTLTVEDPQIVNGQQTSTEIFNYFQIKTEVQDERCLMVRVIVANDAVSRDRIIKATNSQTSMPAASLRATEKIHRDIEEYLAPFELYYDRRKNSQKQRGRPRNRIVSISLMAQAMMSVLLQRPDDARARPSSLIKKDEDYAKIFNPSFPIHLYLIVAVIAKVAHSTLLDEEELLPKDRNNILFYVCMVASCLLAKTARPTVQQISKIDIADVDKVLIERAIAIVLKPYRLFGADDRAAKGGELLVVVQKALLVQFPLKSRRRPKSSAK